MLAETALDEQRDFALLHAQRQYRHVGQAAASRFARPRQRGTAAEAADEVRDALTGQLHERQGPGEIDQAAVGGAREGCARGR